MRHSSKLIVSVLAAAAVLGLAVGAASASRLEIPNSERGFRLAWESLTSETAGVAIRCPVTLEGSFELQTLTKRSNTRIGAVTRAAVGGCTEGSMTLLSETLPWDVKYVSFGGTLPNITSLTKDIIRFSVQLSNGITCLARTEQNQPFREIISVSSGEMVEARADESRTIATSGSFLCSILGPTHFAGIAATTVLGETAHPRLSLI